MKQILCINTGGVGDLHGLRMRRLAACIPDADCTFVDLDKSARRASASALSQTIKQKPWDLVYMESTGIAGGLPLIRAARANKALRYIVSSGDPVSGFFRTTRGAAYAAPFVVYEKQLYQNAAAFVGWTPYLTGRALEIGAQRAVTVEGGVALDLFVPQASEVRHKNRAKWGLPPNHIVCGVVGSLRWVDRQNYCYGLELIETLKHITRPDLSVLIVGDGDGMERLQNAVPEALKNRVVFTGRLPEAFVVDAMNAMDVGFITQTLDGLGSYRLTTKMPEYLACGLPVAMSPTPGFFDYVGEAGWPLPPHHPASVAFAHDCARWLDNVTREEIAQKRPLCRRIAENRFGYSVIGTRFAQFVTHLLGERNERSGL